MWSVVDGIVQALSKSWIGSIFWKLDLTEFLVVFESYNDSNVWEPNNLVNGEATCYVGESLSIEGACQTLESRADYRKCCVFVFLFVYCESYCLFPQYSAYFI